MQKNFEVIFASSCDFKAWQWYKAWIRLRRIRVSGHQLLQFKFNLNFFVINFGKVLLRESQKVKNLKKIVLNILDYQFLNLYKLTWFCMILWIYWFVKTFFPRSETWSQSQLRIRRIHHSSQLDMIAFNKTIEKTWFVNCSLL